MNNNIKFRLNSLEFKKHCKFKFRDRLTLLIPKKSHYSCPSYLQKQIKSLLMFTIKIEFVCTYN